MPSNGFKFKLNVSGLVVLHRQEARLSFVGVRAGQDPSTDGSGSPHGTHSSEEHRHDATFAYHTESVSGFNDVRVPAPDPLYTGPDGRLVAVRRLLDEILWVQAVHVEGLATPLKEEIDNVIDLRVVDPNVDSLNPAVLSQSLSGSNAISRLDISSGEVQESAIVPGPWEVFQGDRLATGAARLRAIAPLIQVSWTGLDHIAFHSNKAPTVRFSADEDSELQASYAVEPVRDAPPPSTADLTPHFPMMFNVVTWRNAPTNPLRTLRLSRNEQTEVTYSDRACPPSKVGS